jgi:hemerythrin-like domain-containing protein
LRNLSEDHHYGLVLARKAKRAGAGEGDLSSADVWTEIETQFKEELEPHFQIEESLIAPPLEIQGESRLAKQLYEEHEALRQFLVPGSERTAADLRRFGELLEKHIRFEERELFEAAQNSLSPEALQAVAEACHARPER